MEKRAHLVSSPNRRVAKWLVADALMLVTCRVAGGSVWRLYKRLVLGACVGGAIYGYLISLDERRKRGEATGTSTA